MFQGALSLRWLVKSQLNPMPQTKKGPMPAEAGTGPCRIESSPVNGPVAIARRPVTMPSGGEAHEAVPRLHRIVHGRHRLLGAGLRRPSEPTPLWAEAWLTATLALLAVAVLGALYSPAGRRPFWGGFAIVGWGVAALNLFPVYAPRLVTDSLVERLYGAVSYTPTLLSALRTSGS